MSEAFRIEHDIIEEMRIPQDVYYGIHSVRAAENFPITGQRLQRDMIVSIAWIKKACARANLAAGTIREDVSRAIEQACDEIIAGRLHDQFIVDPIQGGAGTSTNMNANEVIANRAIEILGGKKGDYTLVNPNDDVNCGQSTNDVYPSCGKMTLHTFALRLLPELQRLIDAMDDKAHEFDAYAAVLRREYRRIDRAREEQLLLNLGGTAVGTGINAAPAFVRSVVPILAEMTGIPFAQSDNLIDATQNLDCYVTLSSALKSCGVSLSKICNDLRLMSSGPRDGLGEINLPARQNGSSIMPGKVNPVIAEVVNQIAFRLIGFDTTVTMAAEAGQLELNAFEPVIFDSLCQGMAQLTNGLRTLTDHCVSGIVANVALCREEINRSVGIVTALCPLIGYDAACSLAKESLRTRVPVGQLAVERGLLTAEQAEAALDPMRMTIIPENE